MPRRRMISPDFWKDPDIRKLTRDERLLFIGCFSNADDEGRLLAHPAHLKAAVFMYDDDLGLDEVKRLRDNMLLKVRNLVLYENASEEYMAFRQWLKHQKPSHPRPSDLPTPPGESNTIEATLTSELREQIYQRDNYTCQYCSTFLKDNHDELTIDHIIPLALGGKQTVDNMVTACKSCNKQKFNRTPEQAGMTLVYGKPPESLQPSAGITPESFTPSAGITPEALAPSQGQSSQGKVRLGESRSVEFQEDFRKFFNSESDLTDLLMTTLKNYIGVGRQRALAEVSGDGGQLSPEEEAKVKSQWGIVVLEKLWSQAVGKMTTEIFMGGIKALKEYPLEVVARAFVKAGRYQGGKHKKWKYIQTIIDEEMGKRGRGPPKGQTEPKFGHNPKRRLRDE